VYTRASVLGVVARTEMKVRGSRAFAWRDNDVSRDVFLMETQVYLYIVSPTT